MLAAVKEIGQKYPPQITYSKNKKVESVERKETARFEALKALKIWRKTRKIY